jgi:hypothetical protein
MRTVNHAEAFRNGERISTAHVESTVNQVINWRMCKKHQMGWSRAGAQQLLHVKTAIIKRATGPVYRAPFSTGGYRRLTPQVFAGLDLSTERHQWLSFA